MIYEVELLAFGQPGEIRRVDAPSDQLDAGASTEQVLEIIFQYGQNEYQPKRQPSVSVGDIVRLEDRWLCCGLGWRKLTPAEYAAYIALPRFDRQFCELITTHRGATNETE